MCQTRDMQSGETRGKKWSNHGIYMVVKDPYPEDPTGPLDPHSLELYGLGPVDLHGLEPLDLELIWPWTRMSLDPTWAMTRSL